MIFIGFKRQIYWQSFDLYCLCCTCWSALHTPAGGSCHRLETCTSEQCTYVSGKGRQRVCVQGCSPLTALRSVNGAKPPRISSASPWVSCCLLTWNDSNQADILTEQVVFLIYKWCKMIHRWMKFVWVAEAKLLQSEIGQRMKEKSDHDIIFWIIIIDYLKHRVHKVWNIRLVKCQHAAL